jgi:hypothetical protein
MLARESDMPTFRLAMIVSGKIWLAFGRLQLKQTNQLQS